MSTSTLTNLRDYLYDTLSPENLIWLGEQLTEYGLQHEATSLKRYTLEELNAMLDQAEADFAAGLGIPDEEVWREYDEECAREKRHELDMAKAV